MTLRTYPGSVSQRVVDGDTLYVLVDLGFDLWKRTNVRLARIDAPERYATGGQAAKDRLTQLLPAGTVVTLKSERLDQYGRAIGDVILADGRSVSDIMVEEGYAVYRSYALPG